MGRKLTKACFPGLLGGRRVLWPSALSTEMSEARRERRERKRMTQGTVKWFSEEKGYGFISPDDGGEDLMVHYTGVRGSGFRALTEGQRVTYNLTHGRAGRMRATNVTKA